MLLTVTVDLRQTIVNVEIKNPIVFGIINLYQCRVGGQGNLGVMSNFNPMEMKFGMKVEFDTYTISQSLVTAN